ncbi:hypothetical protein [Streptomyces sp. NBC_01477]|uniref:hypothetical protein n=1 Tax=Streptomyces sp. NBC_01477 TaxID=2976015 RepID=UPI002E377B29|nr:hypothetical protein [Streptomyces sp. NBC_01477]
MRTTPAIPAEVDTWLAVLHHSCHLHHAEPGPHRIWTLYHPVPAMDRAENFLHEVHQQDTGSGR